MRAIIFNKIKFFDIKNQEINKILNKNGLFLFPSGPGLSTIETAPLYYNSLRKGDYVFFDSGLFVLLLGIFTKIKVNKFSGLKFLKLLFNYIKKNRNISVFCIDPNKNLSRSNRKLLKKLGLRKTYLPDTIRFD